MLGIHGDPVATRRRIDTARRRGERFEGKAYSYPRAFGYVPNPDDRNWLKTNLDDLLNNFTVLDPTAGGGSIPFEAARLGTTATANDLNPVSALIMRATVEWPSKYLANIKPEFEHLSERFICKREERLTPYFPPEENPDAISTNFIWARTITCPYCNGLVPLSPNWRLAPRRDRCQVKARSRFRAGVARPHLLVRDSQLLQGAIGRYGGARCRHLPLFRLRPRDRRR